MDFKLVLSVTVLLAVSTCHGLQSPQPVQDAIEVPQHLARSDRESGTVKEKSDIVVILLHANPKLGEDCLPNSHNLPCAVANSVCDPATSKCICNTGSIKSDDACLKLHGTYCSDSKDTCIPGAKCTANRAGHLFCQCGDFTSEDLAKCDNGVGLAKSSFAFVAVMMLAVVYFTGSQVN